MSIGNLKDTGNQGNNLPYQWKVLQGLQAILDEVSLPLTCVEDSIKICDANGDTLNINTNGSINTVIQNAAGTSVTTTTVGADVGLDTVILTMPATFAEDTAHTSGNTGAFVLGVRNDTNAAMTSDDGDYSPIAVNNKGAVAIQDGGNSITVDGGTGVQRTPSFARPSTASPGTGTVAIGAFSASFASVGTANALVGGMVLKPGETLNFDAGAINNTLAAITYNVTTNAGAELIIITLT
jgi:hypothetical protein